MYKEITLENTLKLLIRCKLAFDCRTKLMALFLTNEKYDNQLEKVQSLIKACNINSTTAADASSQIGAIRPEVDKLQKIAKTVIKYIQATQKNKDEGVMNFIFKGEDLQKKVYREMEEVKAEIKEALKGKDGSKENSMRSSKDTGSV